MAVTLEYDDKNRSVTLNNNGERFTFINHYAGPGDIREAVTLEFDTEKYQLVINIDGHKFHVVGVDYGVDFDEPKPKHHLVAGGSGYYYNPNKPESIAHLSRR